MLDPFRTIHYEVTPEAEAPGGTDEGAEPAPEAEPWTPPTREEVELMEERLERLQLLEQQAQYGQPEPEAEGEEEELEVWDMTADQLRSLIREEVNSTQQAEAEHEEAMERAKDVLKDVTTRDGEFLNPAKGEKDTLALANEILPEMAQRWGFGPKAAEAAIAKAASIVREEELVGAKAYHDRQVNEVRGLANARREPAGTGQGTQNAAPVQGFGEKAVVDAYFRSGTGR